MPIDLTRERTLTQLDYVRLTRLLAQTPQGPQPGTGMAHDMQDMLENSLLVHSSAIDPQVVTMYTQVLLRDVQTGDVRKVALCYPQDAEPSAGFVSVLSPLGASLLGLRAGDVVAWQGPHGSSHEAEIVEVLFQPEATGDYTT